MKKLLAILLLCSNISLTNNNIENNLDKTKTIDNVEKHLTSEMNEIKNTLNHIQEHTTIKLSLNTSYATDFKDCKMSNKKTLEPTQCTDNIEFEHKLKPKVVLEYEAPITNDLSAKITSTIEKKDSWFNANAELKYTSPEQEANFAKLKFGIQKCHTGCPIELKAPSNSHMHPLIDILHEENFTQSNSMAFEQSFGNNTVAISYEVFAGMIKSEQEQKDENINKNDYLKYYKDNIADMHKSKSQFNTSEISKTLLNNEQSNLATGINVTLKYNSECNIEGILSGFMNSINSENVSSGISKQFTINDTTLKLEYTNKKSNSNAFASKNRSYSFGAQAEFSLPYNLNATGTIRYISNKSNNNKFKELSINNDAVQIFSTLTMKYSVFTISTLFGIQCNRLQTNDNNVLNKDFIKTEFCNSDLIIKKDDNDKDKNKYINNFNKAIIPMLEISFALANK